MNSLVDYSSDSDDEPNEDQTKVPGSNSNKRLPVPNCLLKNIQKEEIVDDPSQNEGRIRSFPHERGNWASLVYVPYNNHEELSVLVERLIEFSQKDGTGIELKPVTEPHISLSRTFVLLYHWIQEFVITVKSSLSILQSFRLELKGLDIYVNDEGTRTFLGLTVSTGLNYISEAVSLIDSCLQQYRLKPFYEEGRFHMSICWCLGDKKQYFKSILTKLQLIVSTFFSEFPETCVVDVDELHCKIGNRLYTFSLQ